MRDSLLAWNVRNAFCCSLSHVFSEKVVASPARRAAAMAGGASRYSPHRNRESQPPWSTAELLALNFPKTLSSLRLVCPSTSTITRMRDYIRAAGAATASRDHCLALRDGQHGELQSARRR